MTSEKLFRLEEAKKRKKEEQLKVLIDREAATTQVTVGSDTIGPANFLSCKYFSQTRRTKKILNRVPEIRISSTLTTLISISISAGLATPYRPASH